MSRDYETSQNKRNTNENYKENDIEVRVIKEDDIIDYMGVIVYYTQKKESVISKIKVFKLNPERIYKM